MVSLPNFYNALPNSLVSLYQIGLSVPRLRVEHNPRKWFIQLLFFFSLMPLKSYAFRYQHDPGDIPDLVLCVTRETPGSHLRKQSFTRTGVTCECSAEAKHTALLHRRPHNFEDDRRITLCEEMIKVPLKKKVKPIVSKNNTKAPC